MTFTVKRRHLVVMVVVVLVAGAGFLGGDLLSSGSPSKAASPGHISEPRSVPSSATSPNAVAAAAPESFATLYQHDSSGVVRIDATSCGGADVGTGFLVAPDLVATVAHVVAGSVTVGLTADGSTRVGSVIGFDSANDLALIRSSSGFSGHVFTFAKSEPAVGTALGVIGFPEGGPITFTSGTVSGLDRSITVNSNNLTGMLETDAAINPGNSGGPMFTQNGQVVGLTDALLEGASGIGYAVPVSTAAPELAQWTASPVPLAPANCADPLGPSSTGPALTESPGQSSDTAGIAQTLGTFYDAIDSGDYATAYTQYTSQAQAAESESTFAAEVSSSYDEYATLNAVTPVFPGVDVSWISFTSLQSANQGPNGDTCDDWSLDYTMDDVGGVWLIASAAGHAGGPANTSCG